MGFFYQELEKTCQEINSGEKDELQIKKTAETYEKVMYFSYIARRKGLLTLEEEASELEKKDLEGDFRALLLLVVDGTDPELVEEIGSYRYACHCYGQYERLCYLICLKGVLMIQQGYNPLVIEEILNSMLPEDIREALEKAMENKPEDFSFVGKKQEAGEEKPDEVKEKQWDPLTEVNEVYEYRADEELDEHDHSIVNQCALTIWHLSDSEIPRILKEIEHRNLAWMLWGMPGKIRKKVMENLSVKARRIVAGEILGCGVMMEQILERECEAFIEKVVKLTEYGEIFCDDITILQIVLDTNRSIRRSQDKLRDRYREVDRLVGKIYGRKDN